MYDTDEIDKMDYKQLRTAVRELYDSYAKLKRLFEDTIYNIDESNLATTFSKKLGNNEAMLKITAESIESKVSYTDLENNLSQYSTITQTAQQIQMSVNQSQEYADGLKEEMSSTFTMTADRISTNVVKLNKKVDGNYEKMYSRFEQTAEKIETIVGKELTETFEMEQKPTASNTDDTQKEKMLCVYKGIKYYFNTITQTWREYKPEGVMTAFKQTSSGFEFTGDVKINADLITEGTITGIDIKGSKFWGSDGNNRYFKIASGMGDIGIFEKDASSGALASNSDCAWGVYATENGKGAMYMCSWGTKLLGYNYSQKKLYPMGTWDFSSCNVIGLPTSTSE